MAGLPTANEVEGRFMPEFQVLTFHLPEVSISGTG
jgi:hypothetical protein